MKAYRRIVVATDFSPGSRAALGAVEAIAKEGPLDIQLIHVLELMAFTLPKHVAREYQRSLHSDADTRLNDMALSLGLRLEQGAKIRTLVAVGIPTDEICRAADAARADLVIVGSMGGRAFAARPSVVSPREWRATPDVPGSHRRRRA